MNIQNLIEYLNEIDYPILMEVNLDSIWYLDGDEYIHWNEDGNHTDLEEEQGETYSGELPEGYKRQGGYLIANVNTGCGQRVTRVFALSKEVKNE